MKSSVYHRFSLKSKSNNQFEVEVHQVIKDMQGTLLLDGSVKHIYTIEDGLIKKMEIENH